MKLIYSVHKYDVFLFTRLINAGIYRYCVKTARYVSRTADGYLYLLLLLFLFFTEGWKSPYLQTLLLAFLFERPTYFALKNGFNRNRPQVALKDFHSLVTPSDQFSFPSGHTSAAFIVATITGYFIPFLLLPLLFWGVLVGFSRVVLGVHFPTDTLVGLVLGVGAAILIGNMKIFYGVQGTGNGHITRARVMAKELFAAGFDVTFQFTGRPHDQYFDMQVFNGYQHRDGLTFNTDKGQVNYIKTAFEAKPITFIKDVKALDLSSYDLVLSDFEPVTAWAAKTQKVKVMGIGHQYAFEHDIPRTGSGPIADLVMKNFAPANVGVGLHWHHFGQPILPPIIDTPEFPSRIEKNKIVVYLPFENQEKVIQQLCPFEKFQFHIYSPDPVASKYQHITCHHLSREGFQKDLYDCSGIISNAGFELASEALQLGKKILARPLHAQMEQTSNAAALKQLGYGHTMNEMDPVVIEEWLHHNHAVRIIYPNIARVLVDWIKDGMPEMDIDMTEEIWESVDVLQLDV